jgi:HD-GYP domain-containing protein (c-di-GMP phosphodiesterase class II)
MWIGRTNESIGQAYVEAAHALVAAAEAKETHARRHSDKVSTIAEAIARGLGLRPQLVGMIRTAAQLHDVGKIGVPDAILTKPGPLTTEEFEVVKRHPVIAVEILGQIRRLQDKLPSILHHHEHYDGTGYPAGLSGSAIPVGARVIAVADAIDVMISGRCYQAPMIVGDVRTELRVGAGKQFDPAIVEAAMPWLARCEAEAAVPLPDTAQLGAA